MAGERGAADAERDVRGFAMKYYTDEGNWDLVGNNTPVFFVRDPYKFPDFIRTQKRDPKTNLRSNTSMWDFWSLSPESLHQVTILFSDRGLPKSYRNMNGYGSHTYSLINAAGERVWVKFHLKTVQGIDFLTDQQGAELVGANRESHQADLFRSIESGDFPKWRMCIQVMPEADADKPWFNPFDLTKVWPHGDYPLIEVGIVELNRNPENYFAEVEQSSFSPANQVQGISHSPDKMLQFRIFSYADAHRYRLGVNYETLPVNQAQCPVQSYHRDGAMRHDGNNEGAVNYEPNSFDRTGRGPPVHRAAAEGGRRRRPLQPPRRQRRLQAAGRPVPADDARAAAAADRQSGARHDAGAACDSAAADRSLPEGGFRLRARGLRAVSASTSPSWTKRRPRRRETGGRRRIAAGRRYLRFRKAMFQAREVLTVKPETSPASSRRKVKYQAPP